MDVTREDSTTSDPSGTIDGARGGPKRPREAASAAPSSAPRGDVGAPAWRNAPDAHQDHLQTPSPASHGSGAHRATRALGSVDNYRLLDELGSGGMAVVYRAEDTRLKRFVALKILHDHIASRAENRARLEREARAAARLQHPNIMQVYGFSSPQAPVGYIAAELIDGETLRRFVDRRGFRFPEIGALVCRELALALAHAHAAGVIHRDVKPENVMITRAGVVKLTDFGLARLLDHETLTATGAVIGSPAHLSPEAIEGQPVDERVDVFALGTVLYFATTGRLPFDGRNPAVILNAILSGEYAAPTAVNPRIHARLERIIARCLETDPADRYQTASGLATDLTDWLSTLALADASRELAAFFQDPDAYEDELAVRLVARLELLAREAAAQRRMGAALALCDQLLALDPSNGVAASILAGARRADRHARAARVAGALAIAAVLSIVAWAGTRPSGADPALAARAQAEATAGHVNATAAAGAAQVRAGQRFDATARVARRRVRIALAFAAGSAQGDAVAARAESIAYASVGVAPPPPPARVVAPSTPDPDIEAAGAAAAPHSPGSADAPPVPVTLRLFPPAAMVRIDGVERGAAGELESTLALAPGPHVIELHVPGLQDGRLTQRVLVRSDAANQFSFRVPWPPGYVLIDARSEGNVVFEGRLYTTSERLEVPIRGESPERWVELELLPPDGPPVRARLRVRTEQSVPYTAPF